MPSHLMLVIDTVPIPKLDHVCNHMYIYIYNWVVAKMYVGWLMLYMSYFAGWKESYCQQSRLLLDSQGWQWALRHVADGISQPQWHVPYASRAKFGKFWNEATSTRVSYPEHPTESLDREEKASDVTSSCWRRSTGLSKSRYNARKH